MIDLESNPDRLLEVVQQWLETIADPELIDVGGKVTAKSFIDHLYDSGFFIIEQPKR